MKRISRRSHVIGVTVGVSLVVAAIAMWFGSAVIAQRFTTPVNRSFPVTTGQQLSVSFVPKLTETHYISIALERNLPFQRLQQIVGPLQGEPTARPSIRLDLSAGGHPILARPARSTWWGSSVGFDLASFEAQGGKAYTLSAEVRDAQPDLRTLNGRLLIGLHPLTGERIGFRVLFARAAAVAIAVIGAVLAMALSLYREQPRTL